MSLRTVACAAALLLRIAWAADTLESMLRTHDVPVAAFPVAELQRGITSYAFSNDGPFLLAYYMDDGSGALGALHVIRYDRATDDLRRADIAETTALFQGVMPMSCLGSAVTIGERGATVYIDTHLTPSAGCVLVLSSRLEQRAALSGWLLGWMGADYAIVRRSEVHFMAVHPLHIAVYDVKRNQSTEVYPYAGDTERRRYSALLRAAMSQSWCMEHDAPCDPATFDAEPQGDVLVNEAAKVFAFEARFDAFGFGDPEKAAPQRTVIYFFRLRNGRWEHREFDPVRLRTLGGSMSLAELVERPDLVFQAKR